MTMLSPGKYEGTKPFVRYDPSERDLCRRFHAPNHTAKNFIPEDFRVLVDMMAAKIREIIKKHPEIEALASCGHSGLMMMGALSYVTGLPQIAVRKPHPSDHDKKLVNGWLGCKGFLIIDDFVSSGQTIMKITKDIQKSATAEINAERTSKGLKEIDIPVEDLPQPIACLLYNEDWNSEHTVYDLDGKCLEIPSYSALSEDLEVKF